MKRVIDYAKPRSSVLAPTLHLLQILVETQNLSMALSFIWCHQSSTGMTDSDDGASTCLSGIV